MMRSRVINTIGFICTGTVLLVVVVTKFLAGAWIAILAMGGLFVIMKMIRRHYDAVARELEEQQPAEEERDRAAQPQPRHRAGVQAAPADAAGAGVCPRHPARRAGGHHGQRRRRRDPRAGAQVGRQRHHRAAEGDRLAVPGNHPPGARLRQTGQQGVAAHRRHRVHPRVRRRALVGAGAAQPERAATQGPAAVHAERHGDFCSVATDSSERVKTLQPQSAPGDARRGFLD